MNIKTLIILLTVAMIIVSCERHTSVEALRIVSINNNQSLNIDVADWTLIPDPQDPTETIPTFYVSDWAVPVEFSYIERGIGLPTASSYTARITSYRVSFTKILSGTQDVPWVLSPVTGNTNILVPADPEGQRRTVAYFTVVPASWINAHFRDSIENQSPGIVNGATLKATLIVNGYEEVTREPLTDTAFFMVNIRDSYDDPTQIGK
ncbi:MAG: hypothetical protein NZ601_05525 [candidate division WOR-3 bacterium]|nr:hypothetical protein [candidate division WOR-3 bacterium]MCX7756731.1 hypothetical protein [candidate division WOR-3 bacterium]MDW7987415.1 hypothetical protein [candidate division WOR-3 bacterium]